MRAIRVLLIGVAAISVTLMALGGVAGGGTPQPITVTVTKAVTGGTPPAGATYAVTVTCAATSGGATTASGNANFNGPGGPTTVISNNSASGNHPFCSVTENPNGGATSTSITCVPNNGGFAGQNICDANGNFDSLIISPQTVTVTVTNDFPADPPVIARFTG